METANEAEPDSVAAIQNGRMAPSNSVDTMPFPAAACVEDIADCVIGEADPLPVEPRLPTLDSRGCRMWDTVKMLAYGSEEEEDSEDDERTEKELYDEMKSEQDLLWNLNAIHPALLEEYGEELEPTPREEILIMGNTHFPIALFDFEWRGFPSPPLTLHARRENFDSTLRPGSVSHYETAYDAFVAIWDKDIMTYIASQTNLYAEQLIDITTRDGNLNPNCRLLDWKKTDVDELYVFFAIMIAMGVVLKSHFEEYWSQETDIFCTSEFGKYMTQQRFEILSKCIHFNDNSGLYDMNISKFDSKVYKIRPILDHLNHKFSSLYVLGQNICFDECLTKRSSKIVSRQLLPIKEPVLLEDGIKMYEICEPGTGYQWSFEVSSASTISDQDSLVLKLLKGLEFRGHTVWMNDIYNSPALARTLKSFGIDCVGSLCFKRKYVPPEVRYLKNSDLFLPGQILGCTAGDVDLLIWRGKNLVPLISTYHGKAVSELLGNVKPKAVREYNLNMWGLDKKDKTLASFRHDGTRTKIWYKKVYNRMLNVSVFNAFILYQTTPKEGLDRNTLKVAQHRAFRIDLVKLLLKNHYRSPGPVLHDNSRKLSPALLNYMPME